MSFRKPDCLEGVMGGSGGGLSALSREAMWWSFLTLMAKLNSKFSSPRLEARQLRVSKR